MLQYKALRLETLKTRKEGIFVSAARSLIPKLTYKSKKIVSIIYFFENKAWPLTYVSKQSKTIMKMPELIQIFYQS